MEDKEVGDLRLACKRHPNYKGCRYPRVTYAGKNRECACWHVYMVRTLIERGRLLWKTRK